MESVWDKNIHGQKWAFPVTSKKTVANVHTISVQVI